MIKLRKTLAVLTALELLVGSAPPLWAQRRREEPQANPQFQQDLNRAPDSGGRPMGGPVEPGAPAPAAPAEGEEEPGRVQGVQIGALSAAKPTQAATLSPLESRVSLRVKGAPLATFLDTISAQAKVNFIITEGLETKPVTAFLQNVTVREALQILLEIKGLTYQQIGKSNTYVIAPRSNKAVTLITRVYNLANIPLISISGSAGTGAAAAADTGVAIVNILKTVMSAPSGSTGSPGGQVALDPRTNSLIITDIPEVFPQVEQIIQELDKKAPQIMIEAQFVEINSDRTRQLGLSWGGGNGELGSFTAGTRKTTFPLAMNSNMGKTTFFDPLEPRGAAVVFADTTQSVVTLPSATGVTAFPSLNMTPGIVDLSALTVVLRALVSRSEARFLGKPKVLTLNNKAATMQISNSTAVSRQSQSTSVGGSGATSATTVERVQTGIILSVTPQVNKEGSITMLVAPSVTDVQESAISLPGNPTFDPITRSVSTLVRVKNGQTLVLGGLLQSTESKVVRKVPFLGSIPLLGWLFTFTSNVRRNTDLVIFLTPTIVGD